MSIKKMTVKDKRAAIRDYYERKYEKIIGKEFEDFCNHEHEVGSYSKEFFKNKIRFLVREKNIKLADLDQSTTAEVNKLYKKIFLIHTKAK